MENIWMYILLGFLFLFLIYREAIHFRESRAKDYMINNLNNQLMARSLPEYAEVKKFLETTPKEKIKEMKAENELAIETQKMIDEEEKKTRGSGRYIPVR